MADLETLLLRTSRTFALSIPRLPPPLRGQVTVAYLLFRVADTLEDAWRWDRAGRIEALDAFAAVLRGEADPFALVRRWQDAPPCDHEGYLELLAALPALLEAFAAIEPAARAVIARHALRTTEGMRGFVERASDEGELRLGGLEDLLAYCYVVAGIVGELLTDLFLLEEGLRGAEGALRGRAAAFGEALQLVNILKDAADDAAEGRSFLPAGLDPAAVFARARADLAEARTYVRTLQGAGASEGVVAFCALPVHLAAATLDVVAAQGAGAKLDRATVASIAAGLDEAIAAGRPAA